MVSQLNFIRLRALQADSDFKFEDTTATREAFETAMGVAAARRVTVDGVPGGVLVPLPIRLHPHGSARLEEVEQQVRAPAHATPLGPNDRMLNC